MKLLLILALGLAAASAAPYSTHRILGGSVTNIEMYPFGVVILYNSFGVFEHGCGGTIINTRSVLSAAHCFEYNITAHYRLRVGSSYSNSGGTVYNTQRILNHPSYDLRAKDNDISLIRISGTFNLNGNVRAGDIAGSNYNVPDNAAVWAIGWGATYNGGPLSKQLRHVQIWTVNQTVCKNRYAEIGMAITDNMLCSGWLDEGGRDQCEGDSGGPLIHNNVIVGVCSWGNNCGLARFPGVNARVSPHATWIENNA